MLNKKLLAKVLLFHRLRKKLSRKPRSVYTRPIFMNRNIQGDSILVKELKDNPQYHFRYFRMHKESFEIILNKVKHKLQHLGTHARPISPVERLGLTLRYLATGNSQISLALNYRISPSSVSRILRETMKAICDEMSTEYLPPPSEAIWKENEKLFSTMWNYPNCCGALDGKHIRIRAPAQSGSSFYNYKSFFSIVLLAISNANYAFTCVNIGSSGSQSDGGILMRCDLGAKLDQNKLGLPPPKQITNDGLAIPHVILGDSGFPLKPNLMKPYNGDWLAKDFRVFNYRLSRARMVVENSFGILAARWRIFHSIIECDVELAKLITHAAVILHNFLMLKKDFSVVTPDREENGIIIEGSWRSIIEEDQGLERLVHQGSNNYSNDSARTRDAFKDYFMSPEGSVDWQDHQVTREN